MRCSQARPLLAKQLREPLDLSVELALRRHLVACANCQTEAAELQTLEATLLRAQSAPAAASPAVRVDTAAIIQTRPALRMTLRWLPVTAVSVGLVAMGAAWLVRPPMFRPPRTESIGRTLREQWAREHDHPTASVLIRPGSEIARVPTALRTRPGITRAQGKEAQVAQSLGSRPRRVELVQQVQRTPVERSIARRQEVGLVEQVAVPALQSLPPEPGVTPIPEGRVLPIAFAPPPEPAEESGAVASTFRGDARLAARLVLAEKDRPLGELLPRLGARLHVPLTAGREVADDKLTLLLRERSAAEALTLAARHLGFKWRRTGEGYELRQDLAGRQREQTLLRNELQPIETQLNLAARWIREPDARKKERAAELDTQLKSGELSAEERAQLQAERRTVSDVWFEPARVDASLMLFRSLTPAQIDSTLAGMEYRYSTANGTLPPLIATRIYDSTAILERTFGPQARVQADVTLSLSDVEDMDELPPSRRNRQLLLRTQFSTIRGSKEDPHYWGAGWAPSAPAPLTPQPDATVTDPDLRRLVDLTLPGPERQPATISGGSMICAAQLGAVWPRRATLADVGEAIQRSTGLEVVADSFVSARLDPALLRGRRPLAEVLQKVAEELDYTWEKRGKLLLFRDRRFYRDRPAEVPERILQSFRTRVLRQGELALDDLADLASKLSDTQARGMYRYWGWYLEGAEILPTDYFFGHRQHLRFWASLSPAQRAMLRGGGVLPVADMLPAQRQLWADALTSPPETARNLSDGQRIPTVGEIALGSFSLRITENLAALFVMPVVDGKRRPASGIIVEGPNNYDISKLMQSEPGSPPLQMAGPPLPLAGYSFNYSVGGDPKPLRKTRILIAPLQKPVPANSEVIPTGKERS